MNKENHGNGTTNRTIFGVDKDSALSAVCGLVLSNLVSLSLKDRSEGIRIPLEIISFFVGFAGYTWESEREKKNGAEKKNEQVSTFFRDRCLEQNKSASSIEYDR